MTGRIQTAGPTRAEATAYLRMQLNTIENLALRKMLSTDGGGNEDDGTVPVEVFTEVQGRLDGTIGDLGGITHEPGGCLNRCRAWEYCEDDQCWLGNAGLVQLKSPLDPRSARDD